MTEIKYGLGRKVYLSAILDFSDKSIVSFVPGNSNNNALAFKTFNIAYQEYPGTTPLFHSDRGYQYTSKSCKKKLNDARIVQIMSLVSRCIIRRGLTV
ncbi:IS3 family transposase [Clostridium sp. Marseille-P299]|uniref:IS3 family transposase n=1 Tax=Clostridium sp. Marseille-P299 TaxID=1805477 RepID=UPI00082FB2D1|nr:IS3 family transposase [Clostridium sp. Marseille-P299]